MLRKFGRRSHATVVAYLALFIALGGVSYAAVTLPANSVGTKQIKKSAVKNSDLGNRAVTTAKVKDGSLLSVDFKPGQLVAGAPGSIGPRGPQGLKGDAGTNGAAGPFVDTLPSGKSLKGAYMMRGTAAVISASAGADISFSIPLAAAPTGHFLKSGAAPTADCPGSASVPTAAPGHVCIYEGYTQNMSSRGFQDPVTAVTGSTTRPYGIGVVGLVTAVAGNFISSGGWAVTAP